MNLTKIPKSEQENVLASFWTMLRELESSCDGTNDVILKMQVESWYRQWNRITGDNKGPRWAKEQTE